MVSRRAFLGVSTSVSAGALLAACGKDKDKERQQNRAAADLEIVRFLLRVERVENAFWSQVADRNAVRGTPAESLAPDIARNERAHIETLERYSRRLGGDAGQPRSTDFSEVFAAGPDEVLSTGATIENLSAAAYLGQINRIQDTNLLASVLAIHSVEGRQAAATNRMAGRGFSGGTRLEGAIPDGPFAEPTTMADVRDGLRRYEQ